MKPAALPPLAEGLLLVMLAFAACFLSFEIVRRVPLLRPLFGLGPMDTRRRLAAGVPETAASAP
jgi:hypothetical protein